MLPKRLDDVLKKDDGLGKGGAEKFKTLRHIETVRNHIDAMAMELLKRGALHDQSKLQPPEVEIFNAFTPQLRDIDYGSYEYRMTMKKMKPAIDHHNANNRHHPEYHKNGIVDMNLIDLLELICDWKSASLRHTNGDVRKSIEINQERFGYSDELRKILGNTLDLIDSLNIAHHADES